MTITYDPDSVRMDQIGNTYDTAIGFYNPATQTVRMVGYCITASGQWTENTDMQDEDHLVQIASPSSSDKFTRFPKVSQGDWSGGERQLIYITANQYWQSTQLNTTVPGHLTCNGNYGTATIANGITPILSGFQPPRVVASSLNRVYFLGDNAGTYYVSVLNLNTSAVGTAAASGFGALHEVMRNTDYPVYIGAASGMWAGSGAGTTVTLTPQVVDDNVALINGASMATFAGSVYYITGSSTPNKINSATYPLPGAGAGTTVYTASQMENLVQVLSRGATGLVFITGSGQGVDQYVYGFDGVNANFLGRIQGNILDACEANGTVYILTAAVPGAPDTFSLPVIYSVAGSTLSIFDDFRKVDPAFWPITFSAGGHIESDGTYLWLWYAGLSTKRYVLTTSAISDVGNPTVISASSTGRAGTPLGDGGFVETEPQVSLTTAYINYTQLDNNASGTMLTSWYDFDTPDVDKSFKSIEFAFNAAFTSTALTCSFELDNPNIGPTVMTPMLSNSGLTLIAYFPVGTIGKRVRFTITINHTAAPAVDVQSWSILATLARIWAFPVACRRNPQTRSGPDQQGLTAMQLLENIIDAYTVAGGNVIMWIPDPTASADNPSVDPITGENVIGVSQVSAVIQDYARSTAAGIAPGYRQAQDGGVFDMDGDIQLTLAEALG